MNKKSPGCIFIHLSAAAAPVRLLTCSCCPLVAVAALFLPPPFISFCLCVCVCVFPRWGRWKDILAHGRFKKQLTEWDVESICRALLSYCLVHYRGDDKIKGFMWDLIAPTEDGRTKELQNHLGEFLAPPPGLSPTRSSRPRGH